jgi:hypothetical protein
MAVPAGANVAAKRVGIAVAVPAGANVAAKRVGIAASCRLKENTVLTDKSGSRGGDRIDFLETGDAVCPARVIGMSLAAAPLRIQPDPTVAVL